MRAARRDRGAGSVEYLGVVVLAVVVVGLVVAAAGGVASAVTAGIERAFCSVGGGTGCGTAGEPGSGGPGDDGAPVPAAAPADPGTGGEAAGPTQGKVVGSDAGRRDTARDARGSRRDDRRGADPVPGPPPGTANPNETLGLGIAFLGESVSLAEPPTWEPVDPGAGAYASEGSGVDDEATKFAAEAGANTLSGAWPHASRNLLHFLGNSGEPLEQDVDALLADVPALATEYQGLQDEMGVTALLQAQEAGFTEPVTYPLSTPWSGFYIGSHLSNDWYYAMGGIQWSAVGEVTVYPPTATEPAWTYETTTSLVLRDRYNWDGGKGVTIGPLDVTDEQLAELHRAGVAQEFTATGESAVTSRKGTR
ncbi:hypothetical protein H9657_09520 [Cellulomonas sp. Sa3CUA2]|uniref:Uncharacterized protein n=1 Tax=Cellulomonas avistercoris TaxID=2762242 RepID=A0ABR8QDJ1_9CELL|nr:hypothetical protein [Cellulomonas avistercoris]MBD7918514.1 hypothetical protein [Cellulomonas avistercoris]